MELLFFANKANQPLLDDFMSELREIPGFSASCWSHTELEFLADREPFAEIMENVRRKKCIVVGCMATDELGSVNDHAMQTLVLLDALNHAGADIEALILPYSPYARQDRRKGRTTNRTAITARLFAKFLTCAAPCPVCVVEPHTTYIEGFHDCLVDSIPVLHVFVEPVRRLLPDANKICVVSPDKGGVDRASALATHLQTPNPTAFIDKRRTAPNQAKALQVVGEIKGLDVVIVDDMIDTAGSLDEAVNILLKAGAGRIVVCAVHGLFSGPAVERIQNSRAERVFITSSVAQKPAALACDKIQVIPIGGLLARAIHRLMAGESLRGLSPSKPRP